MSRKHEPGGRIDGETRKAYEAFMIYRSEKTLSKTMDKLREKYGKSRANLSVLEKWCSKDRWVERLQEWEDDLDAKARDEMVKKRRKWEQEEEQIASLRIATALQSLKEKNKKDMSFNDISIYLEKGIDIRHRLCGDVEKINEVRLTTDSNPSDLALIDAIRNMSDEELERQIGRVDKILDAIEGGEIEKGSPGEPCDMEPEERGS